MSVVVSVQAHVSLGRFHSTGLDSRAPVPGGIHRGKGLAGHLLIPHPIGDSFHKLAKGFWIAHPVSCFAAGFPNIGKVLREDNGPFPKGVGDYDGGKIVSIFLHGGKLPAGCGGHLVFQIPQQGEDAVEVFSGE